MTSRLVHRGPDDEGYLERDAASLGHRRLSIIDLEHGHQPMSNPEGSRPSGLQRRGLQLPRAARRAGGGGVRRSPPPATPRSSSRPTSLGPVLLPAFQRHVGARHPGRATCQGGQRSSSAATTSASSRCTSPRRAGASCSPPRSRRCWPAPELEPEPDEQTAGRVPARGLHDHDERTFFGASGRSRRQQRWSSRIGPHGRRERSERYWTPAATQRRAGQTRPRSATAFDACRRAPARRRRDGRDVPVGRARLFLDRLGHERAARRRCAGRRLAWASRLKTFSAVFDGDPIDEQRYIEPGARRDRGREPLRPAAVGRAVRRPATRGLAPGRADGLVGPVRPVPGHAARQGQGEGASRRPRRRRAAGRATCPTSTSTCGELPVGSPPARLALTKQTERTRDVLSPLVRQRLSDRRKAVDPDAFCRERLLGIRHARRHATAADHRVQDDLKTRLLQDLTDVQPSVALALRGSQLDGALDRVAAAVSRSGARGARAGAAVGRHRPRRVEPLDPPRSRSRACFPSWCAPGARRSASRRRRCAGCGPSGPSCRASSGRRLAAARALLGRAGGRGGLFERCCDGELEESPFFWRVLNAEAWLRVFHGAAPLAPAGAAPASGRSSEPATR